MKIKLSLSIMLLTVFISALFGIEKLNADQKHINVVIAHPKNHSRVGSEVTVEGFASIPSEKYLWVLVRRRDFAPLWYPQSQAKVNPRTHRWTVNAVLGLQSDIGWDFDIGVFIVDEKGHNQLLAYWLKAMKSGDWKPIQILETTSPPCIVRVKKVSY